MVLFFAFSFMCFSIGLLGGRKSEQSAQEEVMTAAASKKKPRKRTKVKGHYMQVRQRSTKKGKKGTIAGKWKPKKKEVKD